MERRFKIKDVGRKDGVAQAYSNVSATAKQAISVAVLRRRLMLLPFGCLIVHAALCPRGGQIRMTLSREIAANRSLGWRCRVAEFSLSRHPYRGPVV